MNFAVTLQCVLTMIGYSVPGYILVKTKKLSEGTISAFAVLLMYLLQPCLTINSFQKVDFSWALLGRLGIFFVLTAILQVAIALMVFPFIRKSISVPSARITIIASAAGNIGFMGIPLMNALIPNYHEALAFSAVFFITMGILCWTVGVYCLTGDKKYVSIKKAFFNPSMVGAAVAIPLFLFGIRLPDALGSAVELLAKMSTPVCMLILGMRFATISAKEMFAERTIYPAAALKLVVFPLLAFAVTYFLPIPDMMKSALVIMSACPTATVVLSISELYGIGQKTAALMVLSSTLFSVVTVPVVLMILNV